MLILQIANQWSDAEMVAQAGVEEAEFAQLIADLDQLRAELLELIYLPQTVEHLQVEGFTTSLDAEKLSEVITTVPISRRSEAFFQPDPSRFQGQKQIGYFFQTLAGTIQAVHLVSTSLNFCDFIALRNYSSVVFIY